MMGEAVEGHGFGDAVDDGDGAAGGGLFEQCPAGGVEGGFWADVAEVCGDLVGGGAEGA